MLNLERDLTQILREKWNSGKVLILIGPRQVGKTTLLKSLCEAEESYLFINGDNADDRLQLENAGENKLRNIIGKYQTVFFDEAQRINNIGIILKIIHDQIPDVRLLVSGSSALEISNNINEPLTGRKWEYNMFPFSWNELKKHFPHVYMTVTQPNHEQFAIDWTAPDKHPVKLVRAVFVASRHALDSDQLTTSIPDHQTYCA